MAQRADVVRGRSPSDAARSAVPAVRGGAPQPHVPVHIQTDVPDEVLANDAEELSPRDPTQAEAVRRVRRGSTMLRELPAAFTAQEAAVHRAHAHTRTASTMAALTQAAAAAQDDNFARWHWVQHPTDAWVAAKFVRNNGDGTCVFDGVPSHAHTFDAGARGPATGGLSSPLATERMVVREEEVGPVIHNLRALGEDFDDMVKMEQVDEPTITHNLRLRFTRNDIYTSIGAILISINPFTWLDEIYTSEYVHTYARSRVGEETPPHIFGIANNAYKGLRDEQTDQSIIISGESGAGKTEATKKALQYFTSVAGSSQEGMDTRVLAVNPVLEAFGNAKTVRNNNSSRFGKWMEVEFDGYGAIAGCTIVNYLLEKSRVVSPAEDERSYHIFYQLVRAADPALRAELRLSDNPEEYAFLRVSHCTVADKIDDAAEFRDVGRALQDIDMARSEVDALFRVSAAVLHMGNLAFVSSVDGCAVERSDGHPSAAALGAVAGLLALPISDVELQLTTRVRVFKDAPTRSPLTPAAAADARNALAKATYARMFDWLVARVNRSMRNASRSNGSKSGNIIGVLDIFGFEIFQHNSFEQLCINYCNEKLQQHFNESVFTSETATYAAEGIDFSDVPFPDNAGVLALIEGPRVATQANTVGLLPLLNEQVKLPQADDAKYLSRVVAVYSHDPCFAYNKYARTGPALGSGASAVSAVFVVEHYAGSVSYDVTGFVEKNKDELFRNLSDMMAASAVPFISQVLFNGGADGDGPVLDAILHVDGSVARDSTPAAQPSPATAPAAAAARGATSKRTTTSQAGFFKQQLDALMNTLHATHPHYVRCIKPNNLKRAALFDAPLVSQQLRYAGVFEAVKIRQQGFPFRWTYHVWYQRYHMACSSFAGTAWSRIVHEGSADTPGSTSLTMHALAAAASARVQPTTRASAPAGPRPPPGHPHSTSWYEQQCRQIVAELAARLHPALAAIKFGRTMLLYRAEQHRKLQRLRECAMENAAPVIQRVYRGFAARVQVRMLKKLRSQLRLAMSQRSLPALTAALDEADRAVRERQAFPIREIRSAAALKARVEDELATTERLRQLCGQLPLGLEDEYAAVLDHATELELDNEWVQRGRHRLASVEQRARCLADMESGIRTFNRALIEASMRSAEQLADIYGFVHTQESRAEAHHVLEAIEEEERRLAALRAALSTGGMRSDLALVVACGTLHLQASPDDDVGGPQPVGSVTGSELQAARNRALRDARERIHWEDIRAPLAALSGAGIPLITPEGRSLVSMASLVQRARATLVPDAGLRRSDTGFSRAEVAEPLEPLWDSLAAVSADAQQLSATLDGGMPEPVAAEFAVIDGMLWNRAAALELFAAFAVGQPRLDSGTLITHSINTTALDGALATVEQLQGFVTAEVAVLSESAAYVRRLRVAAVQDDWVTVARELCTPPHAAPGDVTSHQSDSFDGDDGSAPLQAWMATDAQTYAGLWAAATRSDITHVAGLAPCAVSEVCMYAQEVDRQLLLRSLRRAMSTGGVSGVVGTVTTQSIALAPLQRCLNRIHELCAAAGGSILHILPPGSNALVNFAETVLAPLRSSVLAGNWNDVRARIMGVKLDQVPSECRDEVTLVSHESDERTLLSMSHRAVELGCVSGTVDALDVSHVNVADLRAVLESSQSMPPRTAVSSSLLNLVSSCMRMRLLVQRSDLAAAASEARSCADICASLPNELSCPLAEAECEVVVAAHMHASMCHALHEALLSGRIGGAVGEPNLDAISTTTLRAACDTASAALEVRPKHAAASMSTATLQSLAYAAAIILRLRELVLRRDWDAVMTTLQGVVVAMPSSAGATVCAADADFINAMGASALSLIGDVALSPERHSELTRLRESLSRSGGSSPWLRSGASSPLHSETLRSTPGSTNDSVHAMAGRIFPLTYVAELAAARLHADDYRVFHALHSACHAGAAVGVVGEVRLDLVRSDALQAALAHVHSASLLAPATRAQLHIATMLLRARLAAVSDEWAAVEEVERGVADPAIMNDNALTGTEELRLLIAEARHRRVIRELRAALLAGRPRGRPGHLDISALDVAHLEHAINVAVNIGTGTPLATALLSSAQHVLSMRRAVIAADIAALRAALEACTPAVIVHEAQSELEAYLDEVENRAIVGQLVSALSRGVVVGTVGACDTSTCDVAALEHAMIQASELGIKSQEAQVLVSTAELMLQLRRAAMAQDWESVRTVLQAPLTFVSWPLDEGVELDRRDRVAVAIARREVELLRGEADERSATNALLRSLRTIQGAARSSDAEGVLRDAHTAAQACQSAAARQLAASVELLVQLRAAASQGSAAIDDVLFRFEAAWGSERSNGNASAPWLTCPNVSPPCRAAVVMELQHENGRRVLLQVRDALLHRPGAVALDVETKRLILSTIEAAPLDAVAAAAARLRQLPESPSDSASAHALLVVELLRKLRHCMLEGRMEDAEHLLADAEERGIGAAAESARLLDAASDVAGASASDAVAARVAAELQAIRAEVRSAQADARMDAALSHSAVKGAAGQISIQRDAMDSLGAVLAALVPRTAELAPAVALKVEAAEFLHALRLAVADGTWSEVSRVLADVRAAEIASTMFGAEISLLQRHAQHVRVVAACAAALESASCVLDDGAVDPSLADVTLLDAALAVAGVVSADTAGARHLKQCVSLLRRLRVGVRAEDTVGIELALAAVDALPICPSDVAYEGDAPQATRTGAASFPTPSARREIAGIRAHAVYKATNSRLIAALSTGAPSGVPGALVLEAIDTTGVQDALQQFVPAELPSQLTANLLYTARWILKARDAVRRKDDDALSALLAEAQEPTLGTVATGTTSKLHSVSTAEYMLIRDDYHFRGVESQLRAAISSGGPTVVHESDGSTSLALQSIELSRLDNAIATATSRPLRSPPVRRLLVSARLLVQLRTCAIGGDWDGILSRIADARDTGFVFTNASAVLHSGAPPALPLVALTSNGGAEVASGVDVDALAPECQVEVQVLVAEARCRKAIAILQRALSTGCIGRLRDPSPESDDLQQCLAKVEVASLASALSAASALTPASRRVRRWQSSATLILRLRRSFTTPALQRSSVGDEVLQAEAALANVTDAGVDAAVLVEEARREVRNYVDAVRERDAFAIVSQVLGTTGAALPDIDAALKAVANHAPRTERLTTAMQALTHLRALRVAQLSGDAAGVQSAVSSLHVLDQSLLPAPLRTDVAEAAAANDAAVCVSDLLSAMSAGAVRPIGPGAVDGSAITLSPLLNAIARAKWTAAGHSPELTLMLEVATHVAALRQAVAVEDWDAAAAGVQTTRTLLDHQPALHGAVRVGDGAASGREAVPIESVHAHVWDALATMLRPELKAVLTAVENARAQRAVDEKLLQDGVRGAVGKLLVDGVTAQPLRQALRECARTPHADRQLRLTQLILAAELVATARELLGRQDWEGLAALLLPLPLDEHSGTAGMDVAQALASLRSSGSSGALPPRDFSRFVSGIDVPVARTHAAAATELSLLREEVVERVVITRLEYAAVHGIVTGTVDAVDTTAVDPEEMQRALQLVQSPGVRSAYGRALCGGLKLLRDARIAAVAGGWHAVARITRELRQQQAVAVDVHDAAVTVALPSACERELVLLAAAATNVDALQLLRECLASGGPQGCAGDFDGSGIVTGTLEDVVASVRSLFAAMDASLTIVPGGATLASELRRGRLAQLLASAQCVLQLRQGAVADDWPAVQRALMSAVDLALGVADECVPELTLFMQEVQHRSVVLGPLKDALAGAPSWGAGVPGEADEFQLATSVDILDAALQHAAQVGCTSDGALALQRAGRLVLEARRSALRHAWEHVMALLEREDISRLPPAVRPELQALQQEANERVLTQSLLAALSHGSGLKRTLRDARSTPGSGTQSIASIDPTQMDVSGLDAVLQRVSAVGGLRTPQGQLLVETARVMRGLRAAMMQDNLHEIVSILESARAGQLADVVQDELTALLQEFDERAIVQELTTALSSHAVRGVPGALDLTGVSVTELDAAIRYSRSLGPKSHRTQHLLASAEAVRALRAALMARHRGLHAADGSTSLLAVLQQVQQHLATVHPSAEPCVAAQDEFRLIRDDADLVQVTTALRHALSSHAVVPGPNGTLDVRFASTDALDAALARAMEMHTVDAPFRLLRNSALALRALRRVVLAGDWQDAERTAAALMEAFQSVPGTNAPLDEDQALLPDVEAEIRLVHTALSRYTEHRHVLDDLQRSIQARDENGIEIALQQARDAGLHTSTDAGVRNVMNEAAAVLRALADAKAALTAAMRTRHLAALEEALAASAHLGLSGPDVGTARAMRDDLRSLTEEAVRALDQLDSAAMAAVLARAAAMGVVLPSEAHMQRILALPVRQRLQLQLRAAMERGDVDAAVACTLDMKRLFFSETTQNFDMRLAPVLRPLEEVAQLLGAPDAPWLSYARVPLACCLTRVMDAELLAAGPAISRSILAIAGEMHFEDPALLATQLLQIGEAQPALRDEIFVQVSRHLTHNPDARSASRASRLMLLALQSFPPSEHFENFLEAFIRNVYTDTAFDGLVPSHALLTALHTRAFLAGGPALPASAAKAASSSALQVENGITYERVAAALGV